MATFPYPKASRESNLDNKAKESCWSKKIVRIIFVEEMK
jgi:hypothetical protein